MVWSGQYRRSTGRDPDWYSKKPVIVPTDAFYLTGFYRLATCRMYAGGPIPWDAVLLYGRSRGLVGEFLDFFVDVIMVLDRKHRDEAQEEADKERKEQQKAERRSKRDQDRVGTVGARRQR